MNFREGTRRLGLLLGLVGAILGGFASYLELQTAMRQRADYKRFQRLANSEVVSRERREKQASLSKKEEGDSLLTAYHPTSSDFSSKVDKGGIHIIHWMQDDWEDFEVQSIETQDGQTLYPTLAPAWSWWNYLLIGLYPLLGFFVPWGAVRAVGWVGAGFVASRG